MTNDILFDYTPHTLISHLCTTGHSHIRAYSNPDSFSANLEAGFYANTIGFASFDLPASPSSSNEAMEFYHDFLDMNVEQMLSSAADVLEVPLCSTPFNPPLELHLFSVLCLLNIDANNYIIFA